MSPIKKIEVLETSIEKKELRGLNLGNLWGFIMTTAVIILFVWRIIAGYAATIEANIQQLNERVLRLEVNKPEDDKYTDLRIKTIELNLNSLKVDIENLRAQVNENSKQLKAKNSTTPF